VLLEAECAPSLAPAVEQTLDPHPFEGALGAYEAMVRDAGETATFDQFLTAIARHACRLLGAARCGLFLADEGSGLFHGRAGYPLDEWEPIQSLTCGGTADGFTREILRAQKPVVIEDAARDNRPVHRAMVRHNVRDVLGVPMVAGPDVIGLLFVDNSGERRTFSDDDRRAAATFANLAAVGLTQARSSQRLLDRVDELERSVKMHRRMRIIDGHFANLTEAGTDAHEIAALASRLTEKPCSIHALDGRCLAQASPGGPEDPMPRILEAHVATMPEVASALGDIGRGASAVVGPYPGREIMHRCLVSPIVVDDKVWGHIAILEIWRRLTRADQEVVECAARTLAYQLRLGSMSDAAPGDTAACDAEFDGLDLNRHAVLPGPAAEANRCVCVVQRRDGGACGPALLGPLAAAFDRHHAGVRSRASASGERTIALIVEQVDSAEPDLSVARVGSALEAALVEVSGAELIGTSSALVRNIDELQCAYAEARQLMHCLTKVCSDHVTVLTARDVGVGRLLLGSADRRVLDQFVVDTLGPLVSADGTHADLLETLHVFLEASRSPRGAGQRLNVHENTVRYRLAKIAELTGIDVASNHDHQLSAQIAILVLRLRGDLSGYDVQGNRVDSPGSADRSRLHTATSGIYAHPAVRVGV
jgi:hypothetical protein